MTWSQKEVNDTKFFWPSKINNVLRNIPILFSLSLSPSFLPSSSLLPSLHLWLRNNGCSNSGLQIEKSQIYGSYIWILHCRHSLQTHHQCYHENHGEMGAFFFLEIIIVANLFMVPILVSKIKSKIFPQNVLIESSLWTFISVVIIFIFLQLNKNFSVWYLYISIVILGIICDVGNWLRVML